MKLKDWIDVFVIICVVILVRTFLITPAKVNGASMDTTLEHGEVIIVNKIDYALNKAQRFDIVVFNLPNGEKLIKRVIGLGGEKIKCEDNVIYINDRPLESEIKFEKTADINELEIPEGYYYVLGDNRDNSIDSRKFGAVSEENIIGTVNFVLFPFNKFGLVK